MQESLIAIILNILYNIYYFIKGGRYIRGYIENAMLKKRLLVVAVALSAALCSGGQIYALAAEKGAASYSEIAAVSSEFEIKDGVLVKYNGTDSRVVIPESVSSIGKEAFVSNTSIVSVVIPESVTSIGDAAFEHCTSLKEVKLPKSLKTLGIRSFADCSALQEITIPENVKVVPNLCFLLCRSMKRVVLENVTEICECAFGGCDNLTDVQLPDTLKKLDKLAFFSCGTLERFYIPSSVTDISEDAFVSCYSIVLICEKGSPVETVLKEKGLEYRYPQTIVANNVTKIYGEKPFALGAKSSGGCKLTYRSLNKNVATISASGVVTLKGYGQVVIVVASDGDGAYEEVSKNIVVTVRPHTEVVSYLKSTAKGQMTVRWYKDTRATGYVLQYSSDWRFKNNVVQVKTTSNSVVSKSVSKLVPGRKYYVRVYAYKKIGTKQIVGKWSKIKSVVISRK